MRGLPVGRCIALILYACKTSVQVGMDLETYRNKAEMKEREKTMLHLQKNAQQVQKVFPLETNTSVLERNVLKMRIQTSAKHTHS